MSLFYNPDHRSPRTLWAIYIGISRQIDHCIAMGRNHDALDRALERAHNDYWDAVENYVPK